MFLDFATGRFGLIVIAALGYSAATVLMKLSAQHGDISLMALIMAVLVLTVGAEIMLMRQAKLSHAYLTIIAAETLIVILCAHGLGERVGPRELAGGGLILAGIALVSA